MKKTITLLLSASLLLSGCAANAQMPENNEHLKIVTTIYPLYDWTKNVVGDIHSADVSLLINNGSDMHSYQPTAEDIMKISSCDVFIYVGGESDEWAEEVLKQSSNPNMIVLDLMSEMGDMAKEEETVEGMQTEEEHEEEGEEEIEYDEHIWLSLRNADILTARIADALSKAAPEHADTFTKNADAYRVKLGTLEAKYFDTCTNSAHDTLVFADRFPFRYLVDDYKLNYYAAFSGCSADSEASFETVAFLANKCDELDIHTLLTIENNDGKLPNTVIDSTAAKNAQVLALNSMQSVNMGDIENGISYLGVMEDNLKVLETALN